LSSSPEPSSAASERTSHYTELEGATGRDVYFRPERYPRSELGSVGASVQVFLHGETTECQLLDVSQNGFAFEWPLDTPIEVGTLLDRVVIRFDDHEAYRGEARVGSVRRDKVTSVGAALTDTLMNIEDVLQLRDLKARIAEVQFRGLGLPEGPWRVPGLERFKSLIAELRLFLEDTRDQLTALEAVLPWHVSHAEHDSPAQDALIERIRSGFVSEFVRASNEIDAALRSASSSERDALRAYSERHLHDLLMLSPWMHRARHKPLGYPGDFELMNGLYGRHFSGASLFARALNLAFVSTPAAQAVRCRKDLIKSRLSALLEAAEARGEPVRILSIAAGPAEEVYGLLAERSRIGVPVEIVLFDQDKGALAFSYARLNRLIAAKWQGIVRVVHLHDSITRLLRGTTVLCTQGQFQAVYACGLFDYLQPHTWVSLCRSLYQSVAPGGTLYIGNMVPSSPSRWFMELHLNWQLEYRERIELLGLARRAAPDARVQVLEEPTGVNPFVALSRE
jgi:extracellular factor (EF) 3-hydroxypalmitic acid methyl ester biosynthesis protein